VEGGGASQWGKKDSAASLQASTRLELVGALRSAYNGTQIVPNASSNLWTYQAVVAGSLVPRRVGWRLSPLSPGASVGGGCWAGRRYREEILGRYFRLGGLGFYRQRRIYAENLWVVDQAQRGSMTTGTRRGMCEGTLRVAGSYTTRPRRRHPQRLTGGIFLYLTSKKRIDY